MYWDGEGKIEGRGSTVLYLHISPAALFVRDKPFDFMSRMILCQRYNVFFWIAHLQSLHTERSESTDRRNNERGLNCQCTLR